eukprot:1696869-Pyramimonas_sp.AAC.1
MCKNANCLTRPLTTESRWALRVATLFHEQSPGARRIARLGRRMELRLRGTRSEIVGGLGVREDVAPQALTEQHQISLAAAKNLQPGRRNVLSARQSPTNLWQGEV